MPNLFQPTALVGAIAIAMGFSATASAQDSVNASLDTLVVTATRSEEKVKDVPARITVISKSEIEKNKAKKKTRYPLKPFPKNKPANSAIKFIFRIINTRAEVMWWVALRYKVATQRVNGMKYQ